jgi:hypothetical protein
MFASKPKLSAETLTLMTVGPGQLLGEEDNEDIEVGKYTNIVKCTSKRGRLYALMREDF